MNVENSIFIVNTKLPLELQLKTTNTNHEEFKWTFSAFDYLKIYFDYVYFLGLGPFRFVKVGSKYLVKTNIIQKIACYILQGTSIIAVINSIFQTYRDTDLNINQNPLMLLQLTVDLACAYSVIVWVHMTSTKKQSILEMANLALMIQADDRKNLGKWNIMRTIGIYIFIPCIIFYNIINFILPVFGISLYETSWNNNSTPCGFRFTTFDKVEIILNEPYFIFNILKYIHLPYTSIISIFVEFSLFFAALTIREVALGFKDYLDSTENSTELVSTEYKKISELVSHLNIMTSPFCLLVLLYGIPYYSDAIITGFICKDWALIIANGVWCSIDISALIIAAEAHETINEYRGWILKKWSKQQQIEDSIADANFRLHYFFYMEAIEKPVALKCGRIFNITFSSLGTGLGLLATYVIIRLQLGKV